MSNVRTKNDLINIDQFLEQMQNTIYESDENVAAAGVAQPGAHYVHGGMISPNIGHGGQVVTRRLGSTTAITTTAAANGNRRRHQH
jgi:hypothetical protein